jgi:uncharacterized cupredoxin-like copper-binding protein
MRHHRAAALAAVSLGAFAMAAPAYAATTHVTVTAGKPSEMRFTLSRSSVKAGTVVFKIVDKGKLAHDFSIAGHTAKKVRPGKTTTLTVKLKKGTYTYKCTVPGHAAAGMKGKLKVT